MCQFDLYRVYRRRRGHRSGAVYIAVLGVALIVAICALAGMHLARSELQGARRSNDLHRARWLAASAVEQAVAAMNHDPLDSGRWRTAFTHGVETEPIAAGGGTMSFKLVDDTGSLTNHPADPVWIHGYGRAGDAVWVERALARTDRGLPLEALAMALYSSGQVQVASNAPVTVSGAPLATDGNLDLTGNITGDVHAVSRSGGGNVSGESTIPAERKGVPWPNTFADYVARATQLPFSGNMDKVVLAPGVNQYGDGLNANGIYYIHTAGSSITLKNMRLLGTLVIDAGGGTVTIDDQCFMEPFRPDLPVLLIRGTAQMGLKSTGGDAQFRESSIGHNFNPPGAPYLGVTNNDTLDVYPSEIRGLVHVIGNVTFINRGVYRGAVLVQGTVTITDRQYFHHDRQLIMNPPWGYTSDPHGTAMIVQPLMRTRRPSP